MRPHVPKMVVAPKGAWLGGIDVVRSHTYFNFCSLFFSSFNTPSAYHEKRGLTLAPVTLSLRSTALDVVIIPSCVTRCTWGSLELGLHACWPATPVRHNCNDDGLAVLTTFSSCGTRHGCDDRKCVNENSWPCVDRSAMNRRLRYCILSSCCIHTVLRLLLPRLNSSSGSIVGLWSGRTHSLTPSTPDTIFIA